MNLLFEKLSQFLDQNQQIKQNIAGNFLRVSECQYTVTIEIISGNRIVGRMANMQAGDYVRDFEFDGYIITNGGIGQNVTIQVCGGGVGSDRVLGEVSVIDGGRKITESKLAFGGMASSDASAGNFAVSQLFNPAGSGVRIELTQVVVSSLNDGALHIRSHSQPASTLFGYGSNKFIGQAASKGELRSGSVATAPGSVIDVFFCKASSPFQFRFSDPLIIEEGKGVSVINGATGTNSLASFEWREF